MLPVASFSASFLSASTLSYSSSYLSLVDFEEETTRSVSIFALFAVDSACEAINFETILAGLRSDSSSPHFFTIILATSRLLAPELSISARAC